ncbi:type II toxin-antitoxin system RelE/ParE family toxin [bacterium]|nr:type II toxin-antitoxin system RelE/ParE family toxin [bacterium]
MPGYYLVPQARTDLREILNYIAEDSIDAADRVLDRFLEVFELLAENPAMGHFREDLTTHPVRFFPVYSYLVIYMSNTSPVEIVRLLGGAQDVASILK